MEKLQNELNELKDHQTLGKPIVQFLEGTAWMDDELAAHINQADKNLKTCIEYIIGQAEIKANKGRAAVMTDDEVYQLAVKYYETSNKELDIKPTKATVVTSNKVDSEEEDGEEEA